MAPKATGRGSDQFNLRFPPGLRERVKAVADSNSRSMNAEIIGMIEDAVEGYNDREREDLWREIHRRDAELRLFREAAADKEVLLGEQVRLLKAQVAREFFAHLSHLAQTRVFLSIVSESLKKGRPEEIIESVDTLLEVATTELDALRAKREELYGKEAASLHTGEAVVYRQALDQEGDASPPEVEKTDSSEAQWDWENSQADAPPPTPKPTSTAAKRQKR